MIAGETWTCDWCLQPQHGDFDGIVGEDGRYCSERCREKGQR